MNTYLIEIETKQGINDLQVFHTMSEETAWNWAEELASTWGHTGSFTMYRILRNSDGELYLADSDCKPIKP